MRTQNYVFMLLVFDLWIANKCQILSTKNIHVWYVLYKEKNVIWKVCARDLIALIEFVCVEVGRGG